MHAVDWLPTLMTAIGRPGLATSGATDGVDQWAAINGYDPAREEVVYNIKERPFQAAIRRGDYKLVWTRNVCNFPAAASDWPGGRSSPPIRLS